MTEQARQQVKTELIKLGFWGADEPGDPTCNYHDAQKLQDRAEGKLAIAETYPESICLASLALPEFLRRHPECAADQVKAPVGEPTAKLKHKAGAKKDGKKATKKKGTAK